MATKKPSRKDYPAGRSGAAQYSAALRKYNASQPKTKPAPDTRSETQRRRDARRGTRRTTTPTKPAPTEAQKKRFYSSSSQGDIAKEAAKKPGSSQGEFGKKQAKPEPKKPPAVKKPAGGNGGTSGVGPVKSGRTYSTKVSGKSVTQQTVDKLKKMGTSSERFKKLAADAKKKSLEQGKKNREGRNKKRRNARG